MTVAEATRRAAATLAEATDADDARRDAGVLVRHLLGWDMAAWLTHQRDPFPDSLGDALAHLVARRRAGEPVAYITGEKEFYGRPFIVSPDVLIPRPETELLVEHALAAVDDAMAGIGRRSTPAVVLDVGTGSGCIAVTLAVERPGAQITATDISEAALGVARANAARHGVDQRVTFRHGSLTGGATDVDVVVSNPPYVSLVDRANLMRDVRDFEPAAALFGGHDGLAIIAALVPDAFRALEPGGTLLMEIGAVQAASVHRLCEHAGFVAVRFHRDLAGIERVVEAHKPDASV
jgi:release factor glutamine methyltransferase